MFLLNKNKHNKDLNKVNSTDFTHDPTKNMNTSIIHVNITTQIQSSINIVQHQLVVTVVLLIVALINSCFSFISLKILLSSKINYKSRTFALLKLFFANDLLYMVYTVPYSSWHFYNKVTGQPELMTLRTCSYIVSPIYFFIRNSYTLSLAICFDRLLGFVDILKKKMVINSIEFKLSAPKFLSSISILLLINVCLQLGFLIDNYDDKALIELCNTKSLSGHLSATLTGILMALEACLTVSVYIFLLVVIGIKWVKTDTSAGQANNLNEVTVRNYKKLCRVLGYTSLLYFFLGPLFLTAMASILYVLPSQVALLIGSWISISNILLGVFYTTSLLFTQDFRQDFLILFGVNKENTVGQH